MATLTAKIIRVMPLSPEIQAQLEELHRTAPRHRVNLYGTTETYRLRPRIVEERIQSPQSPIIDAELCQDAARHMRIQQKNKKEWQIKKVSELIIDGDNRISLRDLK